MMNALTQKVLCGLLVSALIAVSTQRVAAEKKGTAKAENAAEVARDAAAPPAAGDMEPDPATIKRMKKIDAAGAHGVPDLELKKDERYAHTAEELEPYGYEKPYKEYFLEQMVYTGPGRAKPEPEHVDSVKLGFIGPIMATVSVATGGKSNAEDLGIQMLRGAQLAIKHANDEGGYLERDVPFELVISNDNGLWGASGNEIIKMAYKDKVWAILGTIDGANTHIAIRVALKVEIPMMNSGDLDPTLMETNIPWIFRCVGDDRKMGYMLVDHMYKNLDLKQIGVIRASSRYGRFGVREVRDSSRRLGRPIAIEMAYEVGTKDFSLQLERIRNADIDGVVHWGDAEDGALILNQMREMGMEQPFFACDRCVSDTFLEIAGENAEGVVCGYPWNPNRDDPKLQAFQQSFREEYGEEPDTYSAHGYDGMNMLIWATQVAGLNRAKIRDVLAHRQKPWPGVTGNIPLSASLDDAGKVFLARCENGKWTYLSREDLGIARTDH